MASATPPAINMMHLTFEYEYDAIGNAYHYEYDFNSNLTKKPTAIITPRITTTMH